MVSRMRSLFARSAVQAMNADSFHASSRTTADHHGPPTSCGHAPGGHRDADLGEQLFGLVFVEIHAAISIGARNARGPGPASGGALSRTAPGKGKSAGEADLIAEAMA